MPIRHANQWYEDKLSLFKAPELRNLRRRCDALQRESAEHAKTMERFDEATRSSISKGLANGAKENNTFSDDDILERRAFDPKDALVVKVPSNALYRALVAFLRPRISFDKKALPRVCLSLSRYRGRRLHGYCKASMVRQQEDSSHTYSRPSRHIRCTHRLRQSAGECCRSCVSTLMVLAARHRLRG